jgi:hypothetical protein
MNACKGAGKTQLLHLIAEDLVTTFETVYFFPNSRLLDAHALAELEALDKKLQKRVFVLIDETEANVASPAFTFLLKGGEHGAKNIVTIGAGVGEYESVSEDFSHRLQTEELFLDEEALEAEGVIEYFASDGTCRASVESILVHLRSYCGGHMYPLMALAELILPTIKTGMSGEDAIAYFESTAILSPEFAKVVQRVSPKVQYKDVLQLFRTQGCDQDAILRLARAGFCTRQGKLVSQLLLNAHLANLPVGQRVGATLAEGLQGVKQILLFGLPKLDLDSYDTHGGPVEDAITLELIHEVTPLVLSKKLFQPKLVDAGTPGRRPDMYFNTTVDSYVEALLLESSSVSALDKYDDHIRDFFEPQPLTPKQIKRNKNLSASPHYKLSEGQDWAIVNYQTFGTIPQKPSEKWHDVFEERIFTFLMPSKEIFQGSNRIHPPASAVKIKPSGSRPFSSMPNRPLLSPLWPQRTGALLHSVRTGLRLCRKLH